jgi:hypothetical protein
MKPPTNERPADADPALDAHSALDAGSASSVSRSRLLPVGWRQAVALGSFGPYALVSRAPHTLESSQRVQLKSSRRRLLENRRDVMRQWASLAVGASSVVALSACTFTPKIAPQESSSRAPDLPSDSPARAAPPQSTGLASAPSTTSSTTSSSAPSTAPVPPVLTPFSKGVAAIGPGRWEPWGRHPAKPATHYEIVREANQAVLLARARASVSGLKHRVNRPASDFSLIRWRWRIDAVLQGADVGVRHAEDAPARVLLAFDGDRSRLGMKDLLLSEQFQLFTGQALPYATLMYVWDSTRPEGEVVNNPHTARIRKIVVQTGGTKAGRWLSYERDFQADFARAFGESPGTLIGVGVMTDSDNTRQSARCLYGDVQLLERF